jgi:MFS family permease
LVLAQLFIERTRVISVIYAAMLFGALIILGTGGTIITSFNWEAVYYIFGIIAVVHYFIWILTVYKSPETDRFITDTEKSYISVSLQSKSDDTKNIKIPWRSILSSSAVWAIFAAHFALNWGLYTLLTQMPAFLFGIDHCDALLNN